MDYSGRIFDMKAHFPELLYRKELFIYFFNMAFFDDKRKTPNKRNLEITKSVNSLDYNGWNGPLKCAVTDSSKIEKEGTKHRRNRRKSSRSSLVEIVNALRNLEEKTKKKLKELDILTQELSQRRQMEPSGDMKGDNKRLLKGNVIQQILDTKHLQRLLFRDIQPVTTIYTNQEFFNCSSSDQCKMYPRL